MLGEHFEQAQDGFVLLPGDDSRLEVGLLEVRPIRFHTALFEPLRHLLIIFPRQLAKGDLARLEVAQHLVPDAYGHV